MDCLSEHEGAPANLSVKFSKSDPNIFISLGNDRIVQVNDFRLSEKVTRKIVLKSRSNEVDINPRDPFVFSVGCDDWWSYTFDLRKLDNSAQPVSIHKDHAGPVMSIN